MRTSARSGTARTSRSAPCAKTATCASTTRSTYSEHHWYEDFTSIYHIDIAAKVKAPGRDYEFSREEVLRAMTVGEMTAYLREAGFADVSAYPSFDRSLAQETNSDRMILLALRPQTTS